MCRAILLALCVVLPSTTMGQGVLSRLLGGGEGQAVDIEERYREIKGEKLGAHLASEYAGKKALILLPPEAPLMGGENVREFAHTTVLRGLSKGMKRMGIVGVIEPKLPAAVKAKIAKTIGGAGGEVANMLMPEAQMWFGVRELNKELLPYKGKYDILVCLTALPGVDSMMMGGKKPVSYHRLSVWKEKEVTVALAEGGISRFKNLIKAGRICAVVACKQKLTEAAYEKFPAKDLDEAFNTRFVLITPENVAKHATYFRGR